MKQLVAAVLLAGALFAACDGNSSPTPVSQTTAFQGTFAGTAGQNGILAVTVQSVVTASLAPPFGLPFVAVVHAQAGTVTATGTLAVAGGASIALGGTFNSSAKALSLTGGGFTLTGTFAGGLLSGTYTGPGNVEGAFSTIVAGGTASPTSVTGKWVGVAPGGIILEPGPGACSLEVDLQLDLTSSGTTVTGTATLQDRKVAAGCSIHGADVSPLGSGTAGSGTVSFNLPAGGAVTLDFSGTFTSTKMSGAIVTGGNRRGTFTVNRQ